MRDAPVRDRNPRGGGDGDCAGDSRYNCHRHTGCGAGFKFLVPTAEDIGVTTLQANNELSCFGSVDQSEIDCVLGHLAPVWDFGCVDHFYTRIEFGEE